MNKFKGLGSGYLKTARRRYAASVLLSLGLCVRTMTIGTEAKNRTVGEGFLWVHMAAQQPGPQKHAARWRPTTGNAEAACSALVTRIPRP